LKNGQAQYYNFDAIISVGYRVNSAQATRFRIWATNTLKEFIIKGFILDDDRLKNGRYFGKARIIPFPRPGKGRMLGWGKCIQNIL
jgi:hypothetical protein